ncbi:MAG: hypothetical protein Q9188_002193 [Gyalolechia gomerana]
MTRMVSSEAGSLPAIVACLIGTSLQQKAQRDPTSGLCITKAEHGESLYIYLCALPGSIHPSCKTWWTAPALLPGFENGGQRVRIRRFGEKQNSSVSMSVVARFSLVAELTITIDVEDIDFKFLNIAGRTNKDCRKRWAKIHGPIKKGSWSTLEDQRLKNGVAVLGLWYSTPSPFPREDLTWFIVAHAAGRVSLKALGPAMQTRWQHSLDPNIDHSAWLPEADGRLLAAVAQYGRTWKAIGEKEFPGRSATELKNRYISVHRKRQQNGQPSVDRTIPNGIGLPTPDSVDSDGDDSDSTDSSSDENTTDFQDTNLINTPNTTTTSGLRSLPDPHFQFPNAFDTADIMSTAMIPQSPLKYPFDVPISGPLSLPDNNDYYSANFYQHQQQQHHNYQVHQQHNLSLQTPPHQDLDHYATDRTSFWNDFTEPPAQSSSVMKHGTESGDDRRKGLMDLKKSGDGASTLILEDVQPRMASKIMKMLFEANATVKMKIVSQDQDIEICTARSKEESRVWGVR